MSKLTDILKEAGANDPEAAEKAVLEHYRSKEEVEKKVQRIQALEAEATDLKAMIGKLEGDAADVAALKEQVAEFERAEEERKAKRADEAARAAFRKEFDEALGGRKFANAYTERSVFEEAYAKHGANPDMRAVDIVGELTSGDGVFAAEAQPPAKMPLPGDKGAGDPSGDFKSAIDKLFS